MRETGAQPSRHAGFVYKRNRNLYAMCDTPSGELDMFISGRAFLLDIAAISAALVIFGSSAFANNTAVENLARIENANLTSIEPDHLKTLISSPKGDTAEIQMTRAWIDAQPKASGASEWQCLSEALYFEARGESVRGQFAVAEVIRNRVKSPLFPSSYCGVINQGTGRKYQCQFTYTCDGHKEVIAEKRAHDRVAKIARLVIDGRAPEQTDGATHYHTTKVRPRWSRVFPRTAHIGDHYFYRQGQRVASN